MFPTDTDFESEVTLEAEKSGIVDEQPFHILMLGDWGGDAEKSDLHRRAPLEIDRDNFDDILKKLRVRLDFQSDLSLEFQELDDFHPDQLYSQVPMFAALRDLRRRLSDSESFNAAAREVRDWFKIPAGGTESENVSSETLNEEPPGNLLDAILSKPQGDVRKTGGAFQSREISSLISEIVRPHIVSVDENEQSQLIAVVDSASSALMRKILHDRRFQALESAWRGLYFLVRHTETASDLKIFLLDVSKSELSAELARDASLTGSTVYKLVMSELLDRWSAIFGNYAFEPSVNDTAALIRMSKIAAAAGSPFISHMRPEVLGISSLADQPDPSEWNISADTAEAKLWSALRDQPQSEYLGMAIPRFLVRLPYGKDTEPLETFSFEEFTDDSGHDDYLWTNPCFAVAALLTQSYDEFGWEMANSLKQDIESLPLHIYKVNGEAAFKPCAEVLLSQNAAEKLSEYGLMPLVSFKNTGHIRLMRFQSVKMPSARLSARWR